MGEGQKTLILVRSGNFFPGLAGLATSGTGKLSTKKLIFVPVGSNKNLFELGQKIAGTNSG